MKRRRRAAPRDKTGVVGEAQRRVAQDGDLVEDTRRHILAFMSYLQVEGLKPDSIAGYATTLRRLASVCPGNEFLYLEREDVQEVILALQREGYRTSTMNLFRTRFLRFQRWLRQEHGYPEDYPDFGVSGERLEPGEKPVEFRGIKTASRYALRYGPEDLPTQEDVDKMVAAASGPRDRALVAVLYESAARLAELIGLRMGSVEHIASSLKIHVDGKTGKRSIMLVNAVPLLAAWMGYHPLRDRADAPLWISTGTRRNGKAHFERTGEFHSLSGSSVYDILRKLSERAGVKKRVNPHAFRHARATELARHLKEPELRAYMGWTPGSSMPGIYVHLSGRDTDAAILAAHEVEATGSSKGLSRPRPCPSCGDINSGGARSCLRCRQPLAGEATGPVNTKAGRLDHVLPAIAANPRAMRDLKRLLRKYRLEPGDAPTIPALVGAGT
ncbi:MAG: tyrosine-type recombinase/integrase [Planctomycetota bacterium]|jgi:integrase